MKTHQEISSYKVFLKFISIDKDNRCDATGILSKECYVAWLNSRRKPPKKPMEAFRRALTAHCRGVDGRRPFSPAVEKSLLSELRKKKRWACFEGCDESVGLIGVQGFPSLGFHERKAREVKTLAILGKRKAPTIPKPQPVDNSVLFQQLLLSNQLLYQQLSQPQYPLFHNPMLYASLPTLIPPIGTPPQGMLYFKNSDDTLKRRKTF